MNDFYKELLELASQKKENILEEIKAAQESCLFTNTVDEYLRQKNIIAGGKTI